MGIELGVLVTLSLTAVAGVVWAVRQEGRINLLERIGDERHKVIEAKIDKVDQKIEFLTNYLIFQDTTEMEAGHA